MFSVLRFESKKKSTSLMLLCRRRIVMCSVCLSIAIHALTALSIAPANVDSGAHNSAFLNSSICSSSAVLIDELGRRRSQHSREHGRFLFQDFGDHGNTLYNARRLNLSTRVRQGTRPAFLSYLIYPKAGRC